MKYSLKFDPDITGIAANLKASGNPRWSYLARFCITNGEVRWHGHLDEPSHDSMASSNLLVSPKLASKMQFQEGQSFELKLSNLDAAEWVHLKQVQPCEDALPYVEGVEISEGTLLNVDRGTCVVESCRPGRAYLSSVTQVKVQPVPESSQSEKAPKLTSTTASYQTAPFSQIIGHEKAIKMLKRIADKLRNPEKYKKLTGKITRGVLLHGPPGTGKTLLAREFTTAFNLPANVLTGTVDSQMIYKAFTDSNLKNGGCILLDEIDGISKEAVRTLQQCMDGVIKRENILTIAMTNHLSNIPDELKRSGRFDEIVFVGLPDESDRAGLFDLYLNERATDPNVGLAELAQLTQGFTGADIERVVNEAGDRAIDRLESGETNVVITQQDIKSALEGFDSTGARILNVRKPKISFTEIFGNEDEKEEMKANLDLVTAKKTSTFSSVRRQYVLLHGPPGTGKTMRAEAMASHADVLFKYMSASELHNKFVGDTEKAWRKLFQDARNFAPCLLCIDEIDSLTRARSLSNNHDSSVLNTVLSELDGKADNDGIIIVGITNRLEDLDSAILDRFSFTYKIDLPNEIDRADFLQKKFAAFPASHLDYWILANMTQGWSFRKLANLHDKVALQLDSGRLQQLSNNQLKLLIEKEDRRAVSTNKHINK